MDSRQNPTGINRTTDGSHHNSDEILSDIRHTRGRMDHTLDELGEKLQPRHLLDEVIDYFWNREHKVGIKTKDVAGKAGRKIVEEVRDHPLPALLIGTGIVWLLAEQKHKEHSPGAGYGADLREKAAHTADEAKERIRHGMDSVRERASEMSGEAKEKLGAAWDSTKTKSSQMQHRIQDQMEHVYHQAADTFRETTRAHPMAIGLGCLAFGVIAGVLTPRTRMEDQMMGSASDRLREEGKQQAQEILQEGKQVAERAIEAGKEEAREQGLTPEGLKAKAEEKVGAGESPMGLA
jgi:ElaB/YqjD/DUF883 family membrane-anchored ribosome-binding protein